MAGSLNSVTLVGNVGSEPKMRATQGGEQVANFSVATSHKWKGKDGSKKEETTWHRIVCFSKTAEIVGQYVTKGRLVIVQGAISIREWTDDAGAKKTSYEIKANNVQLLGGRGEADAAAEARVIQAELSNAEARAQAWGTTDVDSDEDADVPF